MDYYHPVSTINKEMVYVTLSVQRPINKEMVYVTISVQGPNKVDSTKLEWADHAAVQA